MKKTIKEDLETKYLKEELVNDNTLLLYEILGKNNILLKMRYIERNTLKETNIINLTLEEYMSGKVVRLNEDNTALAIFKNEDDKEVLTQVYDLETHYSTCLDFMDILYNKKFKDKVDHYLVLKK